MAALDQECSAYSMAHTVCSKLNDSLYDEILKNLLCTQTDALKRIIPISNQIGVKFRLYLIRLVFQVLIGSYNIHLFDRLRAFENQF